MTGRTGWAGMTRGEWCARIAAVLVLAACGGDRPSKFAARPAGCLVEVVAEGTPPFRTENIGSVSAHCAPDISDAVCVRQLQDEACKLGGDVLWSVKKLKNPAGSGDDKNFSGRVARRVPGR